MRHRHARHHDEVHGYFGHGVCRHHGFDRGRSLGREELLAKLERYQRDLEQRTADVADTIRRLKAEEAAPGAESGAPTATA